MNVKKIWAEIFGRVLTHMSQGEFGSADLANRVFANVVWHSTMPNQIVLGNLVLNVSGNSISGYNGSSDLAIPTVTFYDSYEREEFIYLIPDEDLFPDEFYSMCTEYYLSDIINHLQSVQNIGMDVDECQLFLDILTAPETDDCTLVDKAYWS